MGKFSVKVKHICFMLISFSVLSCSFTKTMLNNIYFSTLALQLRKMKGKIFYTGGSIYILQIYLQLCSSVISIILKSFFKKTTHFLKQSSRSTIVSGLSCQKSFLQSMKKLFQKLRFFCSVLTPSILLLQNLKIIWAKRQAEGTVSCLYERGKVLLYSYRTLGVRELFFFYRSQIRFFRGHKIEFTNSYSQADGAQKQF